MSLKVKAFHGYKWSFLIQFGSQLINFIVSIILARILLPEEFGLVGMIAIFIEIGRTLVDGGFSSSIIKEKFPDELDYSTIFWVNLITSIIIYTIIYLTAPIISDFFNEPKLIIILRVLCLVFIINGFSIIQSTKLNKNILFKRQFFLILPSLLVSCILAIWMAYDGYGVWSLIWKELIFSVLSTIQLWFYSKWKPLLKINFNKLRNHFKFGYKIVLTGLVNTATNNIYNIIIGKYFLADQLGFYTRAKSMQEIPSMNFVYFFNRVSYPLLSQIQEDEGKLKNAYKLLMIQIVFWVTPILTLSIVFAKPIFIFLITEKWLEAVPYFQILAISGILIPIHLYNLNICYLKSRSDIVLKITVLKNSLIILFTIFTFWYGIHGLLWGFVIVNFVILLITMHFSGRLINYNIIEQIKDILPIFSLSIFLSILAYATDKILFVNQSNITRIFLGVFGFLFIYYFISYIVKSPAIIEIKEVYKILRANSD